MKGENNILILKSALRHRFLLLLFEKDITLFPLNKTNFSCMYIYTGVYVIEFITFKTRLECE